jgi:hypothetical protein
MGGMQMFNALRSLRSGSSFLLGAAAQQLRLRKWQEQRQQQQQKAHQQQHLQVQQQQPQHVQTPSRLGQRPDASVLLRASIPAHVEHQQQQQQVVPQQQQQQLPQGWQSGVSSFALATDAAADSRITKLKSSSSVYRSQVQQQQSQQQDWEVLLDFLGAFAVFEDFLNRPVGAGASSFAAGRHVLAATSRQPQLSLSYLQQPATSLHLQQQPLAGAAIAAASGRGHGSGHLLPAGSQGQAPGDKLTMTLGHLKLVLGPHSVSMGFQLASSLLDAATAARQADHSSAAASGRHSKAQPKATSSAETSSSSSSKPGFLTMRLQLSVCHVAMNMERMVTADRVRGAESSSRVPRHGQLETLETKGLLSLLLLDVNSSAKQQSSTVVSASAAGVRSSPAAARPAVTTSSTAPQAGRMQVSCSVAHVGLQDLCAPLEQRHVLSGAREPYKVRAVAFFAVHNVLCSGGRLPVSPSAWTHTYV